TARSAERASAHTSRGPPRRSQKTDAAPQFVPGAASATIRHATHASRLRVGPSTPPESHSPDTPRLRPTPQSVVLTLSHPQLGPLDFPPTNSTPTPPPAQNNSPLSLPGGARPVSPSLHNRIRAIVGAQYWACARAPVLRLDSPPSGHTNVRAP